MAKRRIVLIGYRGSGKSTVGMALSRLLRTEGARKAVNAVLSLLLVSTAVRMLFTLS